MFGGRGHAFREQLLFRLGLLTLCAILGGCSQLEFAELVHEPPPSGYRATFGESGGVSDGYLVQFEDVIVLRVKETAGTPIEYIKDGDGDIWMKSKVSRFAVRVGELQGRTITVTTNDGKHTYPAFLNNLLEKPDGQDEPIRRLSLVGRSWSEIKANTDSRLEIELEPRPAPDLIAVGDVVEMTRRYTIVFAMQGDTDGLTPEPFLLPRVETFRLVVDTRGYVAFPALTIPSDLVDADGGAESTSDDALARALRAQLTATQDVLRVADPKRRIAEQTSLQTLAACLSEGAYFRFPDVKGQYGEANRRCWEAGVSPHFGPSSQSAPISGLIYSMTVAPRSWWLVDEQGNRFENPLRDGDTISDAVLRERHRVTGHRLFNSFNSHAYLVVVPRKTVASEVEPPFYLRIGKGAQPNSYRILPGDTVYVTRFVPKKAIVEESFR